MRALCKPRSMTSWIFCSITSLTFWNLNHVSARLALENIGDDAVSMYRDHDLSISDVVFPFSQLREHQLDLTKFEEQDNRAGHE